jgi:fatty acid-binding protein DegV
MNNMPNILNQGYYDGPVACEGNLKLHEDNSVYFDDATVLVQAVDIRKLQKAVGEQLLKVGEYAHSDSYTAEELLKEIDRLREIARVYVTLDRLSKK